MATQTGIITFSGKLGNLIGYQRNGKHFVRSMPTTMRQTTTTCRAAAHFGAVSRKGKLLRRAITPLLELPPQGAVVNRLNKALLQTGPNDPQCFTGLIFAANVPGNGTLCLMLRYAPSRMVPPS